MTATCPATSPTLVTKLVSNYQRRSIFDNYWPKGWGRQNTMVTTPVPKNPLTEEFLKKKPTNRGELVRGDLSSSSIFEDEQLAGPKPKGVAASAGSRSMARNPE